MSTHPIFISLLLGTNRPENIRRLFESLEEKTICPQEVEVIISIDKGDNAMLAAIEEVQKTSPFTIKYLEGVRGRGYFDANKEYNKMLHLIADSSYFINLLSDKVFFSTYGWDQKLKAYKGAFADDIFRVRISKFKNVQYFNDFAKCLMVPDNFPFFTRRWLQLAGGFGDTWGPDTWCQGIAYMLGLYQKQAFAYAEHDYWRDIVASDIALDNYQYSQRVDNTGVLIDWSFKMLQTPLAVANFKRIAARFILFMEHAVETNDASPEAFTFTYDNAWKDVVMWQGDKEIARMDSSKLTFNPIGENVQPLPNFAMIAAGSKAVLSSKLQHKPLRMLAKAIGSLFVPTGAVDLRKPAGNISTQRYFERYREMCISLVLENKLRYQPLRIFAPLLARTVAKNKDQPMLQAAFSEYADYYALADNAHYLGEIESTSNSKAFTIESNSAIEQIIQEKYEMMIENASGAKGRQKESKAS